LAEGGLIGIPYWSDNSESIYFQDQLEKEQSVYRVNVVDGQPQRVYGFGDVLQSPAHYLFNGLDVKGWLYVTVERGLTDIYALDLDLP
jgi:hypothetical protein